MTQNETFYVGPAFDNESNIFPANKGTFRRIGGKIQHKLLAERSTICESEKEEISGAWSFQENNEIGKNIALENQLTNDANTSNFERKAVKNTQSANFSSTAYIYEEMVMSKNEYEKFQGKVIALHKLSTQKKAVQMFACQSYFQFVHSSFLYLLSIGNKPFNKKDRERCDFLIRRVGIVEDALIRAIVGNEDFSAIIQKSKHLLKRFFK